MTSTCGQIQRNIATLLNLCSETNRGVFVRYLRKKEKDGNALSSRRNALYVLTFYDRFFEGRSVLGLEPLDLEAAVIGYADGWGTQDNTPRSGTSIRQFLAHSRAFFRWTKLGELPRAYKDALTRRTERAKEPVPLSDHEFHALLDAARGKTYARRLPLNHALLWALWDSGCRVGEIVSPRLADYHRQPDGSAKLDVNGKTGPRTVDLFESVPALDAWIAIHPSRSNPNAPLFPNDRDESRPMPETSVNMTLKRLCVEAGIRHVNPHLFRHTAASRAAENDWAEAKMRRRFGWTNTSKMPGHYSHLRGESIAERLRKDANVDVLGRMIREDPKAAMRDAIHEANKDLLSQLGLLPRRRDDDEGTPAPVAKS